MGGGQGSIYAAHALDAIDQFLSTQKIENVDPIESEEIAPEFIILVS